MSPKREKKSQSIGIEKEVRTDCRLQFVDVQLWPLLFCDGAEYGLTLGGTYKKVKGH